MNPFFDEVLTCWFGHTDPASPADDSHRKRWFAGGPAFDRELARLFSQYVDEFDTIPKPAFAMETQAIVILLDQISRNIFRHAARAFVYDHYASQLLPRNPRARLALKPQFSISPHPETIFFLLSLIKKRLMDTSLDLGAAPPARATALEEIVEFLLNVARQALPLGFELS